MEFARILTNVKIAGNTIMSNSEPVRYALEGNIATITIDRPHRKNALSVEAMNALTHAWERVETDAQVRVAILTSANCGVFSAGLDLKQASEIRARDGVDILTLMRDPMQTAMRKVTKPIVAAMTGSLMAGGMLLALQCDLRVGLSGTRAGITEVRMGRGTPWAVPLLWMLPQPLLLELVLLGETMPIERLAEPRGHARCGSRPCAPPRRQDRRGRPAFSQSRESQHPCRDGPWLCSGTDRSEPTARCGLCKPRCHRRPSRLRREAQTGLAGQIVERSGLLEAIEDQQLCPARKIEHGFLALKVEPFDRPVQRADHEDTQRHNLDVGTNFASTPRI